jgi:hypothetical protein
MGTEPKSQAVAGGSTGASTAAPSAPASEAKRRRNDVPDHVRIAGIILRTVFMIAVLIVVARVSAPQNESIWTAYETPGDLIRMALGFAVCVWIVIHLFMLPKDAAAFRTWVYLGIPLAPLALACMFAIW